MGERDERRGNWRWRQASNSLDSAIGRTVMARFPLRALGLLLLTVTILGASCQALFAGVDPNALDVSAAQALDQFVQLLGDE
jgi:hypothetical protein